ncbi:hypothetical protein DRO51_03190 [Candidatus Bathyarchaeota archaeon]|nr:MAG: hypothetical protein DRO51_03190 [Candidatus Bathyarchaeota archaeon]
MVDSLRQDKKQKKLISGYSSLTKPPTRKHEYLTAKNMLLQLSPGYNKTFKVFLETHKKVAPIKKIIRGDEANTTNKKLVKTGLLLLTTPEPLISNIGGITLLVAGVFKEKINKKKIYLEDIYKEFYRNFQYIKKLKKEAITL